MYEKKSIKFTQKACCASGRKHVFCFYAAPIGFTPTITEKTWDPLIKGHFILPYRYSGLISDIREYGFILPDWIDYEYDQILDDTARWQMFAQSVDKLLSKSITELQWLFDKHKPILEHNRDLFFMRPYDTLHDKIKRFRSAHIAGKNLP